MFVNGLYHVVHNKCAHLTVFMTAYRLHGCTSVASFAAAIMTPCTNHLSTFLVALVLSALVGSTLVIVLSSRIASVCDQWTASLCQSIDSPLRSIIYQLTVILPSITKCFSLDYSINLCAVCICCTVAVNLAAIHRHRCRSIHHLNQRNRLKCLSVVKSFALLLTPVIVALLVQGLHTSLPDWPVLALASPVDHLHPNGATYHLSRLASTSVVKIKYGSVQGLVFRLDSFGASNRSWTSKPSTSDKSASAKSHSSSPFLPPLENVHLSPIEAYLGVPYASPPTGALRFMPPVTPAHWRGIRLTEHLPPLCPQRIPYADLVMHNSTEALKHMPLARFEWLTRMIPRLKNQSEDCLYLNIYTPAVDLSLHRSPQKDAFQFDKANSENEENNWINSNEISKKRLRDRDQEDDDGDDYRDGQSGGEDDEDEDVESSNLQADQPPPSQSEPTPATGATTNGLSSNHRRQHQRPHHHYQQLMKQMDQVKLATNLSTKANSSHQGWELSSNGIGPTATTHGFVTNEPNRLELKSSKATTAIHTNGNNHADGLSEQQSDEEEISVEDEPSEYDEDLGEEPLGANTPHRKHFHRARNVPAQEEDFSLPKSGIRSEARFPVLVFITGESYDWNVGSIYDASFLASFGQVVVVTLNFRLGILGFLPANFDGTIRGNYGLMDQVAALHWIQENIAEFGGSPSNVTIVGHGHGAACAHLLMLSPMAKGLFSRVILMSGSSLSPWAIARDSSVYADEVGRQLNCPLNENSLMVDCLRTKSVDELLSVNYQVPDYLTAFGPIIDGIVVPSEPRVMLHNIKQSQQHRWAPITPTVAANRAQSQSTWSHLHHRLHHHSPSSANTQPSTSLQSLPMPDLMMGVTRVEAPPLFSSHEERNGITLPRRDRILRTLVRNFFDYHQQAIFYTLVNEYTDWTKPVEHPLNLIDSLIELLSDALVVAPLIETIDQHFAQSLMSDHQSVPSNGNRPTDSTKSSSSFASLKSNLKTYFYVFSHQSKEQSKNRYHERIGASHGDELAYLFGAPLWKAIHLWHSTQRHSAGHHNSAQANSARISNQADYTSHAHYPTLDISPNYDLLELDSSNFHIVWNRTQREVELCKLMISYWIHFASYGDPNWKKVFEWIQPDELDSAEGRRESSAATSTSTTITTNNNNINGNGNGNHQRHRLHSHHKSKQLYRTYALGAKQPTPLNYEANLNPSEWYRVNHLHQLDLYSYQTVHNNRFDTVVWPPYETSHAKYLNFGDQPQLMSHYRSHRLSVWLSLIPRLHVPIELQQSTLSENQNFPLNSNQENSFETELTDLEQDQYFYLRHHLLPDHENPSTYDGVVKKLNVRVPQSRQWQNSHLRQNISSFYEQYQQMLYERLSGVRTASSSSVRTHQSKNKVQQIAQEQFARRRIDDKQHSQSNMNENVAVLEGSNRSTDPFAVEHQNPYYVTFYNVSTESSTSVLHYEAQTNDTYSTALLVTIVVGCSLLVLNILIFIGVYYQLDRKSDSNHDHSYSSSESLSPNLGHPSPTTTASFSATPKGKATNDPKVASTSKSSCKPSNHCNSKSIFAGESLVSSVASSPANSSLRSYSGNKPKQPTDLFEPCKSGALRRSSNTDNRIVTCHQQQCNTELVLVNSFSTSNSSNPSSSVLVTSLNKFQTLPMRLNSQNCQGKFGKQKNNSTLKMCPSQQHQRKCYYSNCGSNSIKNFHCSGVSSKAVNHCNTNDQANEARSCCGNTSQNEHGKVLYCSSNSKCDNEAYLIYHQNPDTMSYFVANNQQTSENITTEQHPLNTGASQVQSVPSQQHNSSAHSTPLKSILKNTKSNKNSVNSNSEIVTIEQEATSQSLCSKQFPPPPPPDSSMANMSYYDQSTSVIDQSAFDTSIPTLLYSTSSSSGVTANGSVQFLCATPTHPPPPLQATSYIDGGNFVSYIPSDNLASLPGVQLTKTAPQLVSGANSDLGQLSYITLTELYPDDQMIHCSNEQQSNQP